MKWITARRRHPLAGYVVVIVALTLFGVGYSALMPSIDRAQAQGTGPYENGADAEIYENVDVSNGRQIYVQSCASCHGLDGQGTVVRDEDGNVVETVAPSLEGVGAAAVDFQVSTGRMPSMDPNEQMPRKPRVYDEQETADLAAYISQEFGGGPEIPLGVPGDAPERAQFDSEAGYEAALEEYEANYQAYIDGGDIDAGQTLYLTNCAHCHSWSGTGGALTGGAYAPPLDEATPRQLYEAMLTGPGAMPVFTDGTLTPQEKQDIITHVKELQMEPDAGGVFNLNRIGQTAEGFIGWVVGLGLIIATAVWITAKQRAHE